VAPVDENPYGHAPTPAAERPELPPVESYPSRVQRALARNASFARGAVARLSQRERSFFHEYITQIHDTLVHPVFAGRFLEALDRLDPHDPLNDWNLHLDMEFEILADGRVSELRVVYPSGIRRFDAAAVDAIFRAAPFPKPPLAIRSWNDRVYLRWGFYRNHRKCGVKNIRPYILERPGGNGAVAQLEE
jgi:TonB family protein